MMKMNKKKITSTNSSFSRVFTYTFFILLFMRSIISITSENLKVFQLRGKGLKFYSKNLVKYDYNYTISDLNHAQVFSFHPVLLELSEIKSLESFSLSYAQGKLILEDYEDIGLEAPNFGSNLQTECSNEQDFLRLTYILSGWMSYTNQRFLFTEINKISLDKDKTVFYSSFVPEVLCHQQIHKIRKNLPKNGLFNTIWKDLKAIVDQEYSSIKISFKKKNQKIFLNFELLVLYKERRWDSVAKSSFLVSSIEPGSHKMGIEIMKIGASVKNAKMSLFCDGETRRLDEVLNNLQMKMKVIKKTPTDVLAHRRLIKPINNFQNEIITKISKKTEKKIEFLNTVIFSSTQKPSWALFDVYYLKTGEKIPYDLHFEEPRKKLAKTMHPWPQTHIKISFQASRPGEIIISTPLTYNLRGYEQLEHDNERGSYIEGTILAYKKINKNWKILNLENLLVDQKQMDNTTVFMTMTYSCILLLMFYTTVTFWGLTTQWDDYKILKEFYNFRSEEKAVGRVAKKGREEIIKV